MTHSSSTPTSTGQTGVPTPASASARTVLPGTGPAPLAARPAPSPLPSRLAEEVASLFATLPPHRRATFERRLERWLPDLRAAAAEVYADPDAVVDRLVALAARGFAGRPEALHDLDERRLLRPDWLQQPSMFGYACYTERFAGDLRGLLHRLDHLEDLGVTYLHLMPLLRPREGDNDGGYAVADYRSVRSDLGSMDDLRVVADELRSRGISLVLDLVLNHVAREHEWAERARAGEQRYRDYFRLYADRAEPDAFEATLPEVFPDFAPGNFTWDDDLQAWVWTTFNSWQWDLNWANPEVMLEMADVVLHLANSGVEVLRLDAIAFLWKRVGTTCQNEPEVHALTQLLRTTARIAAPALAFKAEAIVGPRDLVQYLGSGRHAGRVSDLAYHNSLMVQVWSMLATRSTVLARHALRELPATPSTGTWITYVRCHDDIGWAIDDRDALAVGVTGPGHRAFLADWYAGDFPGSWSDGLVFQHNPATGDKRISGTAASLTGLVAGADPAQVESAIARLRVAHAIVASWGGIPVVWSGDELGQPNDPDWAGEPGHGDDNRWAGRPRLDEARAARRHDPRHPEGRVFGDLAHLARVRAGLPQLHAGVDPEVLPDLEDGVLGTVRRHPAGVFLGLHNVTPEPRHVPVRVLREQGLWPALDALDGVLVTAEGSDPAGDPDGAITLAPYAALWLVEPDA